MLMEHGFVCSVEILKTNDAVVKVMQQYKKIVEGGGDENGLLLQTGL